MAARPGEVLSNAQRAQGDALVEAYAIADDARLADDDAGAVIDGDGASDRGAGMDVDAGDPMRRSVINRGSRGMPRPRRW